MWKLVGLGASLFFLNWSLFGRILASCLNQGILGSGSRERLIQEAVGTETGKVVREGDAWDVDLKALVRLFGIESRE